MQRAMVPLLEELDQQFVSKLIDIMDTMINVYFDGAIAATTQTTNIDFVEKVSKDTFINHINTQIFPYKVKSLLMYNIKKTMARLEAIMFAEGPWICGGPKMLAFDENEQRMILKWVEQQALNKFNLTSNKDKDLLLMYDVMIDIFEQWILSDDDKNGKVEIPIVTDINDDDE